jgi:hypothetical protein
MERLLWLSGKLGGLAAFLERVDKRRFVDRFFRLDPHPHCIFDWYAAPIATHHTYPEVIGWFDEIGWTVVDRGSQPRRKGINRFLWRARTVTVRGENRR